MTQHRADAHGPRPGRRPAEPSRKGISAPGRGHPRPPSLGHLTCRAAPDGTHVVDLSGCRWVDPAQLAGAAAVARSHADAGLPLRVVGPAREAQRRYAARMHLGHVLAELGVEHDLTEVAELDRREDLLELRAVRTEEDALALARLVHSRVAHDPAAAEALFAAVAEMAMNVADHAGEVGYVAAQTLPTSGYVRFAVADAGVGLLATLAGRGARTHRQALHLALDGTSRFADPSRGSGLRCTVREVSRFRGVLFLASGTAAVRSTSPEREDRDDRRLRTPFSGTLVEGVVGIRGPDRRPRPVDGGARAQPGVP